MEYVFVNMGQIMEYGAFGVVCGAFVWVLRYLLCNNKKLAEGLRDVTSQYSNHITENSVALTNMTNEMKGQKDILKEIRDVLRGVR